MLLTEVKDPAGGEEGVKPEDVREEIELVGIFEVLCWDSSVDSRAFSDKFLRNSL
jgi:hypothetical protein